VAAKRNPQTAAKRAREQALREKRERKSQKKQAAELARKLGPVAEVDPEALEASEDAPDDPPAAD
jgi:hypothetical protein